MRAMSLLHRHCLSVCCGLFFCLSVCLCAALTKYNGKGIRDDSLASHGFQLGPPCEWKLPLQAPKPERAAFRPLKAFLCGSL